MDNSLKIEVADDAVTEPKARALERLAPTKRSAVERSRTVLRFKSAAFQSLCAVQQRRKGQALRAAASLLHAAAYGLRASLAGNQQAGGATDFTRSALIPNLDAQDGIRRAGVDSFPVHFWLEDARRVRPPVWG